MFEEQYLYLTTRGRVSGQPRQIEIWFVSDAGKFYTLSSGFRASQWVRNIERDSRVRVRVGEREFSALARVLDPERDKAAYDRAQALSRAKYNWGEGLPVEVTPVAAAGSVP